MKRLPLLFILILISTLPLFAQPESVPAEPSREQVEIAQALSGRAVDLWRLKGDLQGALETFNEAVELAPDNVKIRIERAAFLSHLSGVVVEKDQEQFRQFAREDYLFIARKEPNSISAGIARDMLVIMDDTGLLPMSFPECPPDAQKAYHNAEDFFHAREYRKAIEYFGVATGACPDNSKIWTSYADCYYMLGEYTEARDRFLKALQAEPWNRQAHRFLADTENRSGDNEAGLHHVALAIVSDPTYEAAWGQLRSFAGVMDRDWLRVYSQKTLVTQETGDNGKQNVNITVPTTDEPDTASDEVEEESISDSMCWMMYGIFKATLIVEPEAASSGESTPLSLFELELQATEMTLESFREMDGDKETEAPFWTLIDRANRAGFLKEAIFLHMIDAELVQEYLQYRDNNGERLVEYIKTMIVPIRKKETKP